MITFGEFGSTTTSSAGTSWMPASSSYVEGFSVPPPSSATAPRLSNSSLMPEPVMTASTPQVSIATARRSLRWAICSVMSAMSRCETSPISANSAVTRSGSSVCRWTFSVWLSPTTSTESPNRSSGSFQLVGSRSSPVTAKFVQ